MISPTTGRAVAPDGTQPPPTTTRPPTTQPTTPPTTSPAQPTGQAGVCTAAYQLISNWGSGFQGEVTVRNNGSSTLNGWTVRMALASGQAIQSLWNGVNTATSGAVSVKNQSYNGVIGANGSATFGFVGSGNGSAAPAGMSCSSP